MKTTKYNGVTYQLDESNFKPAYIEFDQDMFDDEIFPVLVGLGFEVENHGSAGFLVNNKLGYKLVFSFFRVINNSYLRTQCHTATEFLNASGIFSVADVDQIPVTAEIVKSITVPYSIIDQTPNDAELGALVRKIRMS
jgi:hypothetical protein